ncbi:MAG: helix-turn-helix domain-containing protein [Candidatus Neomarinimicrobiota bacterium]
MAIIDDNSSSKAGFLNSREVAALLGVNVSTIKRWTDSGKLNCIQTAGRHRKFAQRHISEFLMHQGRSGKQANLIPLDSDQYQYLNLLIQQRDYDSLIPLVIDAALKCRHGLVKLVLEGLFYTHGDLAEIYEYLFTPVLHQIGERWSEGAISINEEHLASQTIRDVITGLMSSTRYGDLKSGRALCLTLSAELHDIALKMVQHLLQDQGWEVLFIGQLTALDRMEEMLLKYQPDRLCLSVTIISDIIEAEASLSRISELSRKHNIELLIGGQGIRQLNFGRRLTTVMSGLIGLRAG